MVKEVRSYYKYINITIFFILMISAPGIVQRVTGSGSQTGGFLLALVYSLIFFKQNNGSPNSLKVTAYMFCISVYGIILVLLRSINYNISVERLMLSLPIFIFIILQARVVYHYFTQISQIDLTRMIFALYIFYLLNGVVGLTGVDIIKGELPKAVGVFTEPSFFGLVFAPILIASLFIYNSTLFRILVIFSVFLFGVSLQSLTLVLVGAMSTLIFIKLSQKFLFITILLVGSTFTLISSSDFNLNYYIDRLPFLGEPNITNYYYFQSIEELMITLKQSNYLGVGFQQHGVTEPNGYYANLIYDLSGFIQTRYDGASFFYKISSEFGIFGFFFCIYLLWRSLCGLVALRAGSSTNMNCTFSIFLHSCSYSFLIFIFVRGSGYFNITFFLILIIIYSIGNAGCSKSAKSSINLNSR